MRQKINKSSGPKTINDDVSLKELPISSIILSGKVKFLKLARITFIFNTAPALIIFVFFINGYMSYPQSIFLFAAIFFMSLLFYYPYVADLQQVTSYVDSLAKDQNPVEPKLSFINDVDEISLAVKTLNSSWQQKNDALKLLLLEDEILINSLPNIILMLDHNLNFLKTNQAAANTFGRKYLSVIESIINDDAIQNICHEILISEKGANIKYEMQNPHDYFFDIRIEKFPFSSPNNISLIMVLQNLTQEKATEKMLSDFVANASHEMKTPLSSITGFIETLAEYDNDVESRSEFLKIMKEQAGRMARVINDLLSLSVIESAKTRTDFVPIDISDAVEEACLSLSKLIEKRKVHIFTESEPHLPKISGRYDDMIRLCDNLISNAVKYSAEGSEVNINIKSDSNANHKFTEFLSDQQLVILTVMDKGIGIDEKDVVRLTERFFRVDKSRSNNLGGTGLGLSIVKHIVSNHLGRMEIESELGRGSIFTVYLPAI